MHAVPIRRLVLRVYAFLGSMRQTARVCSVSVASISRWLRRIEPLPYSGRTPMLSDAIVDSVQTFLTSATRFSSLEVVQFLEDKWKINASRQLAHCIVRRLGFTFKRTRKRYIGGKVHTATQSFFDSFDDSRSRGGCLVAVDESGFDQRVRPVYGYSFRGSQAIASVAPCKDRRRYNLLMAIHESGDSVSVLSDCPTTGESFASFISQLPYPAGTTVLLDNAAIHKTRRVRYIAALKGYRLLFTPPYSPEFNPIEMVFGVVKNAFYKARYHDKFRDDLKGVVERCVHEHATPTTIQGCFSHVTGLIRRRAHVAMGPQVTDA